MNGNGQKNSLGDIMQKIYFGFASGYLAAADTVFFVTPSGFITKNTRLANVSYRGVVQTAGSVDLTIMIHMQTVYAGVAYPVRETYSIACQQIVGVHFTVTAIIKPYPTVLPNIFSTVTL